MGSSQKSLFLVHPEQDRIENPLTHAYSFPCPSKSSRSRLDMDSGGPQVVRKPRACLRKLDNVTDVGNSSNNNKPELYFDLKGTACRIPFHPREFSTLYASCQGVLPCANWIMPQSSFFI